MGRSKGTETWFYTQRDKLVKMWKGSGTSKKLGVDYEGKETVEHRFIESKHKEWMNDI